MRVAIVNDLPVATEVLRRVVCSRPEHTVAWSAASGEEAVRRCGEDPPDVVLMDLVMPGMNGAEATKEIMRRRPCPILVVTATVAGNYSLVCEALGNGAYDAVATPVLGDDRLEVAGAALLNKLNHVNKIRLRLNAREAVPAVASGESVPRSIPARSGLPVVLMGASTGGPQALRVVLSSWPRDVPAAFVIAQHISAEFACSLTNWLGTSGNWTVRTARDGDQPAIGTVLVAGTDDHLTLTRGGTLLYTREPANNPFRPSVDVLFESFARHATTPGVAVLLTGIGRDGARGLLELRQAGWYTIAQDERTCVVYGMPQAAREIGAAVDILAVDEIAARASQHFRRHHEAPIVVVRSANKT